MTEKKKISAIIAAVNTYMDEEAAAAKTSRLPKQEISLWRASGRQEIMQMRTLWQRRIVPMR